MREPLNIDALCAATQLPRIDYTAETGSTNADLVKAALQGAPEWTAAVTEYQSAGRGRHGRVWTAPPMSQATMSILIRPSTSAVERLGTMPLVTGLALIDALSDTYDVALKWPNDVLINGRKVCGILAEVAQFQPEPAIVIGLGLNVSLSEGELPVPHAISLEMVGGPVDRTVLVGSVLIALKERLTQWMNDEPTLMRDYRAVCSSIGQQVRVHLPGDKELLGECIGVADDGLIQVQSADAVVHEIAAGDVVHLRLQQ
ncbi:biotin--[acetyl-CoA-carboxylase] ligase [Corynebacterium sp. H127]|uniref:biotin--[acetyl-CoA-carboxylase] ligase n=1 Tax=Corynebacterium sp. H127 TaxID=3133418 RepID=UPI0030AB98E0